MRFLELMCRAGTLPLCEFGPEDCVPHVVHMIGGPTCHRPDAILVGEPLEAFHISPRCLPLPLEPFHVNAAFIRARASSCFALAACQ